MMTTPSPTSTSSSSNTHWVIDVPRPSPEGSLHYCEQPRPVAGPGQVLIRVHAAGVNMADTKQARGTYDMPPGAGTVPGLEVAGEVVAVGAGTSRYQAGDRVCALTIGGGYAEYCAVPEVQVLPVPSGLSMVEAAGLPETTFTVWMIMFERGRLGPGETVLVHGGAGGIGTTAIQMAVASGARVFATAGHPDRCRRCTDLGAELAINYSEEDFAEAVERRIGPEAVDVIVDTNGSAFLERNLRLLAIGGRLSCVAHDGGRFADFNLLALLKKRVKLTGGSLRRRPVHEKGELARQIEHHVWPWVVAGRLTPQIGLVVPLEEAESAHRALLSRAVTGKAILTTDALAG